MRVDYTAETRVLAPHVNQLMHVINTLRCAVQNATRQGSSIGGSEGTLAILDVRRGSEALLSPRHAQAYRDAEYAPVDSAGSSVRTSGEWRHARAKFRSARVLKFWVSVKTFHAT